MSVPSPSTPPRRELREAAAAAGTDPDSIRAAARALAGRIAPLDLPAAVAAVCAAAEGGLAVARLAATSVAARRVRIAAGCAVREALPLSALLVGAPDTVRAVAGADGNWTLTGAHERSVHPQRLERALVLCSTAAGTRLFDVDLRAPGVGVEARALAGPPPSAAPAAPTDPSGTVHLDGVPGEPVGGPGWWIGHPETLAARLLDTACWQGAALAVGEVLRRLVAAAPRPGSQQEFRLGRATSYTWASGVALDHAAGQVAGGVKGVDATLTVERARAAVAGAAETVLRQVTFLADPRAPELDPADARRVAHLQLTLRRWDPEHDLAAIGRLVTGRPTPD